MGDGETALVIGKEIWKRQRSLYVSVYSMFD